MGSLWPATGDRPPELIRPHVHSRSRFIVRDFSYDEEAIEKQKTDLAELQSQEKELWVRDGTNPI